MKFSLQLLVVGLAVGLLNSVAFANKIPLGPVKFDDNGHWYELVPDVVNYPTALAAAASRTHDGVPGHLVTITSEAENVFVSTKLGSFIAAWVAGSDSANEGDFLWTAGPEAGQLIWTGGKLGSAAGFANFPAGTEPNDAGGTEDVLEVWYYSGTWNDQDPSDLNCYIVEYESVPEPAAAGLALGAFAWLFHRRKAAR